MRRPCGLRFAVIIRIILSQQTGYAMISYFIQTYLVNTGRLMD